VAVDKPVTVPIRVKPGSSVASVGGSYAGPYGDALIVAVNAPAVDGRANEAVLRAVAKALAVRPGSVSVRLGTTARNKLLEVSDAPVDLAERLRQLLTTPHR
jgi:uncharacterized protein